jgi:hypothetical protein
MPPDAKILLRRGEVVVSRDELADYTYSGVYQELGGATSRRRKALLKLGKRAFETILDGGGLAARQTLEDAGRAVAGGHIRIVSFDATEQEVLDRIDASGDLDGGGGDSLLVAAQNFSADKMDFWTKRRVRHSCAIAEDAAACTAEVELRNDAPEGLTRYVAGKPYGAVEDLVEVYVPEAATIGEVDTDGLPVGEPDRQDGHAVVGAYLNVGPGERRTLSVSYELPLPDGVYSLEIAPQPLAHDAVLQVALDAPEGWVVDGDGETGPGYLRFDGVLDHTMRFSARPDERRGLSGLWDAVAGFWNDPLF